MARRPKKEVPSGDWMNTYADMVTLLLCFFVLLFSMSSVNAQKWEIIVGSFNPDATILVPVPSVDGDDTGEDVPPVKAPEDAAFDEIFEAILQAIQEQGLENDVNVEQTVDGLVFINFKNDILFNGDSSVLRSTAYPIMDALAQAFEGKEEYIGEIRFLGHTTQKYQDRHNDIFPDRLLAAERSVAVCAYIQGKNIITPKKLVTVGYGQEYPVVPFFSGQDGLNRRTEILIMQNDYVGATLDQVYEDIGISTMEP